jgi:hypothetical protein
MQQGSGNDTNSSLSLTFEQAQAIGHLLGAYRPVTQVSEVTRSELLTRLLALEKWEKSFMS